MNNFQLIISIVASGFLFLLLFFSINKQQFPVTNDKQQVIKIINCSGNCLLEDKECIIKCEKECPPKSSCEKLFSETKLSTMETVLCFDNCLKSSIKQDECYQLCTKNCKEGTLCWLQFITWYKQIK